MTELNFNLLDIGIIALLFIFTARGYIKGFAASVLGLFSFLISALLTRILYPYAAAGLRMTGLYDKLKEWVYNSLNLSSVLDTGVKTVQTEILDNLSLPGFLKDSLVANNNPIIYENLGVSSLGDYIAGFLASALLNLMAVALVFLIVSVAMRFLSIALKIITKLPVIGSVNRIIGGATGLALGLLIIWAVLGVASLAFVANPAVAHLIEESFVARFFQNNNYLLNLILK